MSITAEAFTSCCKCARDGFGGAVLSHAGCIAAPAIIGLFGGSLSHTFMATVMYITSPLIAMGATWAIDRLRGETTSLPKLLGAASIALIVAFGINEFIGHDHGLWHSHPSYPAGFDPDNMFICGPSFQQNVTDAPQITPQ